jgi:hypothetical protein
MPLKAIDFSKTIIYKISKDDDFYVGSTTDFATRKSKHKHSCNNDKNHQYNYKVYQTIRDKGGWDTWEMTPLEEYVECKSKTQARIREEEWRVKLNASLNARKAFGNLKEYREEHKEEHRVYDAQYYQNHKEEIKIKNAKYNQDHKNEIKVYQSQYYQEHALEINTKKLEKFECGCKSVCRISDKARHEASKKHQRYLANLIK